MQESNNKAKWVTRRSFMKVALAGAGVAAAPMALHPARAKLKDFIAKKTADPELPITRVSPDDKGAEFLGDHYTKPHNALWAKDAYLKSKGGIPAPSETVNVVVIGGGMSGLAAAHRLKDLHPVLLEQAPQLGGNSKGETWKDATYSLGAAYVCDPEEGSKTDKLLKELGLSHSYRVEKPFDEETVLRAPGNKLTPGFWQGGTDPARAAEFAQAWNVFKDVRENHYPDIPVGKDSAVSAEELAKLDRMSYRQWLDSKFKNLHPHLSEFFEEYCWSASLGTSEELSAAQMLNFFSWDLRGIAIFPGGNAMIADALARKVLSELPKGNVRASSLVVDVALNSEGVRVCYEDAFGDLRSIQAKRVVVSSAKFIAAHFLDHVGAPIDDQLAAMKKLKYRAYVVANILVNKKLKSPTADMVRITGEPPKSGERREFTDLIFAAWAAKDHGAHSSLTLYCPIALQQGRQELYAPDSFGKTKKGIEGHLAEIQQALALKDSDIGGLRISRWGHAFPLAEPGLIADGVVQLAARPIADRIFFCQQDNWANPAFETAIGTAKVAAEAVLKSLGQNRPA